MLQWIILWICAFAICELVEPPDPNLAKWKDKRSLSGGLQGLLLIVAVLAIIREGLTMAANVWGW